ncbi:hypothetical protein VHEMI02293 [[Torrubiella] hemipterigena]|uniref:Enoyl-CoA hydratase n=1 Tax=[Torrubiella] hemipterigena TaxID=1531966 RepID=A0A0A1SVF7_9HYPO|nr:hypothetical protein VHEMI02293 [[Torrubiella] hemipterigena]
MGLQPPAVDDVLVTFPTPQIMLVTINRAAAMNAITRPMHTQLDILWRWYDAQPSLRCALLTGTGRAFCAGADLKEWDDKNTKGIKSSGDDRDRGWKGSGFGGLSNRRSKKPIVGAVNGLCLGGGMEIALNLDMIIASEGAKFGLPEVKIGVVAIAGALPRLIRTVGRQRASEMALLGRMYTAKEMEAWGVVNKIVPAKEVLKEALKWAAEVSGNSPDSVIVTMAGLLGGWDGEDPVSSTNRVDEGIYRQLDGGENQKEGVKSFVEKRKPVYRDSKL